MANLGETFSTSELPQGQSFDPIPAGWYSVTVTSAEVKTTKAGNGQYIAVRYDVTGPTHEGRVVFGNFNIRNANPKAEEIGRQQLGDMMRSIGLASVSDTDQLIGGQCQIKVSIKHDEQYGDGNEIKGWKTDGAGPIPTAAPTAAPASAQAAPPWAKK